ncbi:MAG: T9SS type A sorting domain-containing protein [Bacteroidetes bacterium]|nr:T9SS type A sorting domain-containing protein [Bacteroidota bacterium]
MNDPNVDIDPTQLTIEHINPVSFNPNNNGEEPCAPEWSGPNHQRLLFLDSLNNILDSLNILLLDINNHLQEENTSQLLYEIETNNSDASLMNILSNYSPLSTSLLHELNAGDHALSTENLKDLLLLNSSFEDQLYLEIINNELFDSLAQVQLKDQHMRYNENASLSSISNQIKNVELKKSQVISLLTNDYLEIDSMETIINMMQGSSFYFDKQILFSYYLAENLLDSAANLLEDLDGHMEIDPDWLFVQNLLLNLASNNSNVFRIDSLNHLLLSEIASKNQGSVATANARAILKLVFNEEYWDILENIGNSRLNSQFQNGSQIETKVENLLSIDLKPNPASNFIDIKLLFSKGSGSRIEIEIINTLGTVIHKIEVTEDTEYIHLNTSTYAQGIYFIKIDSANLKSYKKFVILR